MMIKAGVGYETYYKQSVAIGVPFGFISAFGSTVLLKLEILLLLVYTIFYLYKYTYNLQAKHNYSENVLDSCSKLQPL